MIDSLVFINGGFWFTVAVGLTSKSALGVATIWRMRETAWRKRVEVECEVASCFAIQLDVMVVCC
jgi:hypothetical protein